MWGETWGTMVWGGASAVPVLGAVGVALLCAALLGLGSLLLGRQRSGKGRAAVRSTGS